MNIHYSDPHFRPYYTCHFYCFFRLTSLRKTSSNSESNAHLNASRQDLSTEKGTIHTKRHSQEDPQKENNSKTELTLSGSLRSAGSMASSAGSAMVAGIQRVGEKVRALSGSTALMKHDVSLPSNDDPMAPMTQLENPHHNQVISTQVLCPISGVFYSNQDQDLNTVTICILNT